jgi:hypothetical protein
MPEIYIGNDFGPDRLLHNESTPGHLKFRLLEGKRHFTDPKSFVLGHDSFKGMGCDFGDLNQDGLLDIYVSNIADKFALAESHFLWQSTGDIGEMRNSGSLAAGGDGIAAWRTLTTAASCKLSRPSASSRAQ